MKIKYTRVFEVDPKQFPNLTAKEIREHFVSCADSYMQQVEQETISLMHDENQELEK
ncbi:hypothetical protein ACDN41_12500 [Priestia aryabhattai]|uniref:hypothetical protein n=1 Tax=Priestia aryabhattai TaxID=412384 RepID=UPI00353243BB